MSQKLLGETASITKDALDRAIDENQVILIELELLRDRLKSNSEKMEIDRVVSRLISLSRTLAQGLRN